MGSDSHSHERFFFGCRVLIFLCVCVCESGEAFFWSVGSLSNRLSCSLSDLSAGLHSLLFFFFPQTRTLLLPGRRSFSLSYNWKFFSLSQFLRSLSSNSHLLSAELCVFLICLLISHLLSAELSVFQSLPLAQHYPCSKILVVLSL